MDLIKIEKHSIKLGLLGVPFRQVLPKLKMIQSSLTTKPI